MMNCILLYPILRYLAIRSFYSNDVPKTSGNVKYYKKTKYEKKVMVWITISPKRMTPAFIMPSGQGSTNIFIKMNV